MRKTGAQIITTLLERQDIRTVAGIPGGSNLPLYDALRDSSIQHVLARHEQGAGFIAQGMARATAMPAVCLATSGPGATNLLTAIADAKLDSVPIVAITGQVPSSHIGTDAFQEVDVYGLTVPITKHNFLVRDARELLEVIPRAFELAGSGRPGPVVVDVPKDIQTQQVTFDRWPEPWRPSPPPACRPEEIRRLAAMINAAEHPILYMGGGIILSGATEPLAAAARKNAIPIAATLAGLGAFPCDDPLHLGMLGMHGAQHTNLLLEEADLLIAIGVRFDDRATGRAVDFCRHAAIAHIDIDPSEISKIKAANLGIVGDAAAVLRALEPELAQDDRRGWWERIAEVKARCSPARPDPYDRMHPINLIEQLAELAGPHAIVTTDVGQHQMWAAQAWPFRYPRTFQTSGGLGTMGFGLPAAIGAALGRPDARVICISGDGSLLMNIQELATLSELGLNVTVLLMNNGHLGLVRQQQELFYGGRYHATQFEQATDFAAIARAFGIAGLDLDPEGDPRDALSLALSTPGPCLINAPIRYEENVLPMVPPGGANTDMLVEEPVYA